MKREYFLPVIRSLLQKEELVLYGAILEINEQEAADTVAFLKKTYEAEAAEYPGTAPAFDAEAALWAARTLYVAAQLVLYREHKPHSLPLLLPSYEQTLTPAAILSADLCLRFLPDLLTQLKLIDPDDELIGILETHLSVWHYSGIRYLTDAAPLDVEAVLAHPTVRQLYTDRIIRHQNIAFAKHEAFRSQVLAGLGIFAPAFSKELITAINTNEQH